ncbi:hypothetical protein KIN20_012636 [Parelaphostrongylus tenuis]|uniref:Uncharacterized protein n=1 Tax=Parelaphostrongylus tenuis TaxID=148309 RepID=A0AAD5MTM1_PARTN|nr:hypothetical protein KIN20_012636 [Parelaphostrongylus tenuis]
MLVERHANQRSLADYTCRKDSQAVERRGLRSSKLENQSRSVRQQGIDRQAALEVAEGIPH